MINKYYRTVGEYFDDDADAFDERYWSNSILQRTRQAFREEVKRLPFHSAVEVGCGTGLDLVHFATIYPQRNFYGVDVSSQMINLTRSRIASRNASNAEAKVASADDLPELFGTEAIDLAYVFFGALNTVEDLNATADRLYETLAPGGYLVLTFVNRPYIADAVIEIARGRWKNAFRRMKPVWGGYSPDRYLPSRCVSAGEVRQAFGRSGDMIHRRGFSITYPAWYRRSWVPRLRRAGDWLWEFDKWISQTPFWRFGEYSLFVFQKRTSVS
jgi:ubiquinone/menaquinone biosynthesis C-methylase UbiE